MDDSKQTYGTIGVLMGGVSSEREISLKSGKAVVTALKEEGLNVVAIDIKGQDDEAIKQQILDANFDIAFIVLHGKFGEDGRIQAILENLNIPYTGSGVEASRLALYKEQSQKIFKNNGIDVPDYVSLRENKSYDISGLPEQLGGFPLVVKPSSEGSSIGVNVVSDQDQLAQAVSKAFALDTQILIEKFIEGRELTVGILGEMALPVIEICPDESFFNFEAKYQKGKTQYIIPAVLSDELAERMSATALNVHKLLGCCDLSRVDFMLDNKDRFYVLEINTIPGFTETSLLPKAANQAGISFNQLCRKLVGVAYGKKKEKRKNTVQD